MTVRSIFLIPVALLLVNAAGAQSLDDPLPIAGGYTPMQWIPASLKQGHSIKVESYAEEQDDLEIVIAPEQEGPSYTLRFVTGPATEAGRSILAFAQNAAKQMGDQEAAEIFDLSFPDGVPCLGVREDNQIVCAFDDLAMEFGSEQADYETLRELADEMPPLQTPADALE